MGKRSFAERIGGECVRRGGILMLLLMATEIVVYSSTVERVTVGQVVRQSPTREVRIAELNQEPVKYSGQRITVKGTLRLIGSNYYRDPSFALVDESGIEVSVPAWAPLEVPPPFPGNAPSPGFRPRLMSDYLGRYLAITGVYQVNLAENQKSMAVESVVEEADTGKSVQGGPNLTPFKPSSWSDKIVVSKVKGTNTDASGLTPVDTMYIDFAVLNTGTAPADSRFYIELYVDGVIRTERHADPPLNPNTYIYLEDYELGALGAGTHTIRIKADSTGAIPETNESDNEYTKTVIVSGLGGGGGTSSHSARSLILLADFPDKRHQTKEEFFQALLFGNHPAVAPKGSFKDYYLEVSYGKWEVDGNVVAWVTLPEKSSYYADQCFGIDMPTCTPTYPRNAQKMIEDAVIAAKNARVDFSSFDTDNDGSLDSLFVIHAGPGGESSNNPNDIWSHAWTTHERVNTGAVNSHNKPIYVQKYTTEPEYLKEPKDMTIGVFAHEYGHHLGLPDLYDTDDESQGVGVWSIMASGAHNGIRGDSPAHMDAWSKFLLGWITPTKVTGTLSNLPIAQVETNPVIYQILDGSAPKRTGEYFLVENRQSVGFDASLPATGLLIWHIDERQTSNDDQYYPGCDFCTGHYKVAVVQADNKWDLERKKNRGDAGDPYPGTCGSQACNTSFSGTTGPSSNLNDGRPSGVSVTAISASGATMTATLSSATGIVPFTFTGAGAYSSISTGADASTTVGYARIRPNTGLNSPSGVAIFGVRQRNVLVSEAGVPATPPVSSGRIYAEMSGFVNTGLALANPNNQNAVVTFYFNDANGNTFGQGSTVIPPNGQLARFLTEPPYNGASLSSGTFTFSSSVPVAPIALRGLTNERSEFLVTTLPVAPLSATGQTVIFPHFADGGGWSTQIILINPTDAVLNGTVQFYDEGTSATPASPIAMDVDGQTSTVFSYRLSARGAKLLRTSNLVTTTRVGSVRVVPASGSNAPTGLAVFSFRASNVTVTEAGVPAVSAGAAFRLYAETSGAFTSGQQGSVQTGFAITNTSRSSTVVSIQAFRLDGSSAGISGSIVVPGDGHVGQFLYQIPGLESLATGFQGILRVASSGPGISVVGLRGRYNERSEFLITTTPALNEATPVIASELVFPHFADGGGFTTQFILFSSNGSATSGNLGLFSQSGKPVSLSFR